ncbi:hypothetical protein AHF37_08393 [Paragonimus kellicotti]|nr:hypothetical protein AHF37_08393 [Paragonimus kellicotti]
MNKSISPLLKVWKNGEGTGQQRQMMVCYALFSVFTVEVICRRLPCLSSSVEMCPSVTCANRKPLPTQLSLKRKLSNGFVRVLY